MENDSSTVDRLSAIRSAAGRRGAATLHARYDTLEWQKAGQAALAARFEVTDPGLTRRERKAQTAEAKSAYFRRLNALSVEARRKRAAG